MKWSRARRGVFFDRSLEQTMHIAASVIAGQSLVSMTGLRCNPHIAVE
jgi:hypothetical protein